MNNIAEKKFFERFSFFHPEKSVQESLMAFGFECGDGWKDLLWNLCERIDEIVKRDRLEDFEVIQVKEKFGTLRFYAHNSNKEILELIYDAEVESEKICESCGLPGAATSTDRGWITTICEECKGEK